MKKYVNKMVSMVIAVTLMMTFSVEGTVTEVQAAKGSVKSVKVTNLKKRTVTLKKGKTKVLKVKVVTKGKVSKKFIAQSNNKKVAIVKKSGKKVKIIAKNAGTAKITIKSKANKKKKTVIKVKVTQAQVNVVNDIAALSLPEADVIKVDLKNPQQLTGKNFVVDKKVFAKGNYNKTCKISDLMTSDKKTYYIILEEKCFVGNFVKVAINGLSGNNKSVFKEIEYTKPLMQYQNEQIVSGKFNSFISADIELDGYGYVNYSMSGLPQGVTSEMSEDGGSVLVRGIPVVKGTYNAKLVAKDEIGNTFTTNVIFVIGASDSLAAGTYTSYLMASTDMSADIDKYIVIEGGSGQYYAEILGESYGLKVTTTGYDEDYDQYDFSMAYLTGKIKNAGTYRVEVKITDRQNQSLSTTVIVPIYVTTAYKVTGTIKDRLGKGVPFANVEFRNENQSDLYCTYDSTITDFNGNYEIYIPASTYNILANCNKNKYYFYSMKVTSNKSGVNMTILNLNKAIELMQRGVDVVTNIGKDIKCFEFIPENSGYYVFSSQGAEDTYGYVYNANGEVLAQDDDGGEMSNFLIKVYLQEGQKYYLGVKLYSDALSREISLNVKKVAY